MLIPQCRLSVLLSRRPVKAAWLLAVGQMPASWRLPWRAFPSARFCCQSSHPGQLSPLNTAKTLFLAILFLIGTLPYVTALIQDSNDISTLGANQVKITVTNNFATTPFSGSVTQLGFNLSPYTSVALGQDLNGDGSGVAPSPTVPIPNGPPRSAEFKNPGENQYNVDGSTTATNGFDIGFEFQPTVYTSGQIATIILTDITASPDAPTLSAASFLATNASGLYTAAKIQRIGQSGESTVLKGKPKPIPAPLPILGAGIAFSYSRKLRQRLNQRVSSELS